MKSICSHWEHMGAAVWNRTEQTPKPTKSIRRDHDTCRRQCCSQEETWRQSGKERFLQAALDWVHLELPAVSLWFAGSSQWRGCFQESCISFPYLTPGGVHFSLLSEVVCWIMYTSSLLDSYFLCVLSHALLAGVGIPASHQRWGAENTCLSLQRWGPAPRRCWLYQAGCHPSLDRLFFLVSLHIPQLLHLHRVCIWHPSLWKPLNSPHTVATLLPSLLWCLWCSAALSFHSAL